MGVGARDDVCRRLRGVVGVDGAQGHLLGVRAARGTPIGLVRRCDDDPLDQGCPAAGLQDRPGPLDVVAEGVDRIIDRRSDQRLGRQVDDRVNAEVAQDLG